MNFPYTWVIRSIVATIAILGLWAVYKGHEQIIPSIRLIGWQGFIFLCLFSTANYALRYLRWNYLLGVLGDRVSPWESLLCYLSGFAFTTTPAKSGEVVRCFYFHRRHGIDYSHTLAGLLTERTMDALAAILIGSLALYTFTDVRWIGGAFTFCVFLVIFLISHQALLLRVVNYARTVGNEILDRFLDLIPPLLARTNHLLSPKPFTVGMVMALFAWSTEAVAFAWLAQKLGGDGSILLYMSIFCVAIVAGALTFIPGGLGGTEIVLYLLLVATGLDDAQAVTVTILIRLATLWYAVFLGLASVLWLELDPKPTGA